METTTVTVPLSGVHGRVGDGVFGRVSGVTPPISTRDDSGDPVGGNPVPTVPQ